MGWASRPTGFASVSRRKAGGNHHQRLILGVTRPVVEELDLYIPVTDAPAGQFRHLRSGFKHFGASDDLGYRFPALVLPADLQYGAYIYLRLQSKVACYSIDLFTESAFIHYSWLEYSFFGLTTGIMLAMFLYNLAIAVFFER